LARSKFVFVRRYKRLYEEERKGNIIAGGQALSYTCFFLPTKILKHKTPRP
jgi:hypothetical protein